MSSQKSLPLIRLVEWIGGSRVRIFFSTGRTSEVRLPVRSAKRVKVVDMGMGIDPGDGKDMSASLLYTRGRVIREGHRGIPMRYST